MEAIAKLNSTRGSARKARLVIDSIRGKDVDEALNILRYSPKKFAAKIEKLVESAINNWAQKNEGHRPEDSELYISEAYADGGTIMRRYQPAPFGRAYRIRKRSSHITIVVDSRVDLDEYYEEEEYDEETADENIEEIEENEVE